MNKLSRTIRFEKFGEVAITLVRDGVKQKHCPPSMRGAMGKMTKNQDL